MLNNKLRILYVNLTLKKIKIELREDLKQYLGGVGIASKLLEENMVVGKSPLDPEQPIVLAIGILSSVFPLMTKTVATFISPLTGEFGESYAGGRLAYTIFNAGFDAIVITGKADSLSYMVIENDNVEIRDARSFRGMGADSVGQYIRTVGGGSGKRSIIRIGPAGESLSKIACVNVDTYRHFGRLGLGACFGSKNLKAIVVTGGGSMSIPDMKKYFDTYREIYARVTSTSLMSKYHDLGTAINVKVLNDKGSLPTRNLQATSFEHVDDISGEHMAENNLIRKVACVGCPIGCIHIGQVRKLFGKGYDYQSINVSYDYELISAMGSLIGIDKADDVLELISEVEEIGYDVISSGCCLSWATEMYSRGSITDVDTLVPLKFGNKEGYLKALQYMKVGKTEFYKALANGISDATARYGGADCGLQIAKNEMPQYHTGYGSIVGYVFGARHSHLCNGGYSIDQKMKEFDKDKLVESIFNEEVSRNLLNSLIACLFGRSVYDTETIHTALEGVGIKYTTEELNIASERIYATKLRIKKKLGFNIKNVKIPQRILTTEAMGKKVDPEIVKELIEMLDKKNEELLAKYSK
ncbi:MAG TPA: aldehyde ferredoxin oxidoreductase N-terminal domain-containing protein [Clostridia bacterium]|nr:aldehyde ferredoxin oxidoreductase N-terminal domain-containing protein [Clostridia bacterium]